MALAAACWFCWVKSEAVLWNQGSARVVAVKLKGVKSFPWGFGHSPVRFLRYFWKASLYSPTTTPIAHIDQGLMHLHLGWFPESWP